MRHDGAPVYGVDTGSIYSAALVVSCGSYLFSYSSHAREIVPLWRLRGDYVVRFSTKFLLVMSHYDSHLLAVLLENDHDRIVPRRGHAWSVEVLMTGKHSVFLLLLLYVCD